MMTDSKTKRCLTKYTLLFLWLLLLLYIFNKYAYEIDTINANLRSWIRHGTTQTRIFDENGIPHSYNARLDEPTISPFYVVHYGILYSQFSTQTKMQQKFHWKGDESLKFWDVPPPKISEIFFKNSADWVVNHISFYNGYAHLMYDFDWPYSLYPNGTLKAPWWSGLTDSYAIILLLRAADTFDQPRYLQTAKQLYDSATTPIEEGGSLGIGINGPWIEEYVVPGIKANQMSKVLNGKIYAYYGIRSYEEAFPLQNKKLAKALEKEIVKSFPMYGLGDWSYYDLLGTPAVIKYHVIDTVLLNSFSNLHPSLVALHTRWERGLKNVGYYYLTTGKWTVAKFHFTASFMFLLFIPSIGINFFRKRQIARLAA